MNHLKNKVVYLCGSIHAVKDAGIGWRDYITPILTERYNVIVDDPCKKTLDGLGEVGDDKAMFKKLIAEKKFKEVKEKFYRIVRKDLRSVDKADFLIVHYNPKVHIFGTIHEIITANLHKTPILIKYEEENLCDINPWLFCLIKHNWLFSEWNDMFNYLDQINRGETDSSHWW